MQPGKLSSLLVVGWWRALVLYRSFRSNKYKFKHRRTLVLMILCLPALRNSVGYFSKQTTYSYSEKLETFFSKERHEIGLDYLETVLPGYLH